MNKLELSQRDEEIFRLIMANYFEHGTPAASETLSKEMKKSAIASKGLSSATIRSVMADLEKKGLLDQPHTSAGRLPSSTGLRYYVDCLMECGEISTSHQKKIDDNFDSFHGGDYQTLLKRTSRLLALLSTYAGIVMIPRSPIVILKHIECIHIGTCRVLFIIVDQQGNVYNSLLHTDRDLTVSDLEKMTNTCNKIYYGLTLEEAKKKALEELMRVEIVGDSFYREAVTLSQEAFTFDCQNELIIEGEDRLMEAPDFEDVIKLKSLVYALREKDRVMNVLSRLSQSGQVNVVIGDESNQENIPDCGLVTIPYRRYHQAIGMLAVIGPMRMDYSRVVPLVRYTSIMLAKYLERNQVV